MIYKHEFDADAFDLAQQLVGANPEYAPAYVIDICRTDHGLKMLETNCINAAGFYAADLTKLVSSIEGIGGCASESGISGPGGTPIFPKPLRQAGR